MLCCIYSQSLLLDMSVTCLRRLLHRDGEGANNIVWDANAVFLRSNTSNSSSGHVLTVALTMHKSISLPHKFDENMKGDSKLLITKATFGFC